MRYVVLNDVNVPVSIQDTEEAAKAQAEMIGGSFLALDGGGQSPEELQENRCKTYNCKFNHDELDLILVALKIYANFHIPDMMAFIQSQNPEVELNLEECVGVIRTLRGNIKSIIRNQE